jgi:acyl-[acyl-carrier-protein] desaturase
VAMTPIKPLDTTGLEKTYFKMYREFFDQAEKRRRWNLRDDIPWHQANKNMDPAVALVVESYCCVEMFLPDYIAKTLPQFRNRRGRAWFHFNWGYEESKHSLALGDWLLASGLRTEEEMWDLEQRTLVHEWDHPATTQLGMVIYGMVQELATWLNYRNLKRCVDELDDPALSTVLRFLLVDERCHHDFYMRVTKIHLDADREGTLRELRDVLKNFAMPAISLMADCRQREAAIRQMHLFDEDIFYRDVLMPMFDSLGITWAEFRERKPGRKTLSRTELKKDVA